MIDLIPALMFGLVLSCMITIFSKQKIETIQDADALMQYSKLAACGGISTLFFTIAIIMYFIASLFH